MPAKSGSFPRFSGTERGDGTRLRQRLDHDHARGDRAAGKVPLEEPLAVADELAGDVRYSGLELEHLVDEEKRVAVRDDRLDDVAPERRANDVCELTRTPKSRSPKCTERGES